MLAASPLRTLARNIAGVLYRITMVPS